MTQRNLKISDHIEIHDRNAHRKAARSGLTFYVYNGHVWQVDNTGAASKLLRVAQSDTTDAKSPGFGSWTTADAQRPSWVELSATAVTDGTSVGEVTLEVDEDGDGTVDYSFPAAYIAADNAAGTDQKDYVKAYVPAGGQYRIANTSDPSGSNSIDTVREVTA